MKRSRAAAIILTIAICITSIHFFRPEGRALALAYGVDVSYAQGGSVDWAAVRDAGVSFALIRVGYTDHKDLQFETNYANAKAAGINVGCYIYTYGKTVDDAAREAQEVITWLGGRQLEYPVYYDMEDTNQRQLTTAVRTAMCNEFCARLYAAGYLSGVYASKDWFKTKLDRAAIAANYQIWEAAWHEGKTADEDLSAECGIWQYSDAGYINGFSNAVDLDVAYTDYPSIVKQYGLNGYTISPAQTTNNPLNFTLPSIKLPSQIVVPVGTKYKFTVSTSGSYITGVTAGTTRKQFVSDLGLLFAPVITDVSGSTVTDNSALIGTDFKVRFLLNNYKVVVTGDLDGDGAVTAEDARQVLRTAVELDSPDYFRSLAADYDGDSGVTAEDARLILRAAIGL